MNDKLKKLLLVDDEDDVRESIEMLLSLELDEYEIIEASSGNEAIEIVKKGGIDFVLSDVKMADGNGIELLEKIREYHPEVPAVVLITGFSMITRKVAIEKGAKELISKPFDVKKIVELIRSSK